MNREFVYHHGREREGCCGRRLVRWAWGVLCCGLPGVPCYYCNCCGKVEDVENRPRVNQSTTTSERVSRPHRPHAPGRKPTPESLTAVRCALSQLQGEPAPPPETTFRKEPG